MTVPIDIVILGVGWAWYTYRRWQPYLPARLPTLRLPRRRPAASPHPQTDAPAGALTAPAWLALLNEQPDDHPHLLIAGKSGSGKTTFARAVLTGRTGAAVVLSAKVNDGAWQPLPSTSYEPDGGCDALLTTIEALRAHLRVRTADAAPLTVIVDDYPALVAEPELRGPLSDLVARVGRVGRATRMRLMLLSQETTGRATGMQGQVALLENFTPVVVQKGTHRAMLTTSDGERELDTRGVPALARRALALQAWEPTETVSGDVSGVATVDTDTETVAFRAVARLIAAGLVPETRAIETAFGVRAGSSQAYQRVRAGVKAALGECQDYHAS